MEMHLTTETLGYGKTKLLAAIGIPLCCMGDFNTILDLGEKFEGNMLLNANNVKFKNFTFEEV
jgi:hypothetical protein